MAIITFSDVKIHNEIELCRVANMELKKQIEKEFLARQISYFEKWEEPSLLSRLFGQKSNSICIICVNSMQKEKAEMVLDSMKGAKENVELILKKVDRLYF